MFDEEEQVNFLICGPQRSSTLKSRLETQPIGVYMQQAASYTKRHLTVPEDILTAFRGTQWLLQEHLQTAFLFGLPVSHFDLALLWQPRGAMLRRMERSRCARHEHTNTQSTGARCECVQAFTNNNLKFPLWSWSGWLCDGVEFQDDFLRDVLVDVNHWLNERTWIQWYIRDERGILRPLWQLVRTPENTNMKRFSPSHKANEGGKTDSPSTVGIADRWLGYNCDKTKQARPAAQRDVGQPLAEHLSQFKADGDDYWRSTVDSADGGSQYLPLHKSGHDVVPVREAVPNRKSVTAFVKRMSKGFSGTTPTSSHDRFDSSSGSLMKVVPVIPEEGGMVSSWLGKDPKQPVVHLPREVGARSTAPAGSAGLDEYGRKLQLDTPQGRTEFERRIPDHPFGVRRDDHVSDPTKLNFMPILQFFTWYKRLHVLPRSSLTPVEHNLQQTTLRRYEIHDDAQKWCGSIVLDQSPTSRWQKSLDRAQNFIALSFAGDFSNQELPFSAAGPEARNVPKWDIYFVMMLTRNEQRGLWERAGLGKVMKIAFEHSEWKEIKLG
jgi:hypothetical protein